jgi:hypothetical protein
LLHFRNASGVRNRLDVHVGQVIVAADVDLPLHWLVNLRLLRLLHVVEGEIFLRVQIVAVDPRKHPVFVFAGSKNALVRSRKHHHALFDHGKCSGCRLLLARLFSGNHVFDAGDFPARVDQQRTVAVRDREPVETGDVPDPATPACVSMSERIREAGERARARAQGEPDIDPDAKRGEQVATSVRTAAETLADTMAELDRLKTSGAIDEEVYQRAAAKARDEAQRRIETEQRDPEAAKAEQRGQQVAASVKTADEVLADKMAELDELRGDGAIDDETYRKAATKAQEEASRAKEAEQRDPIREQGQRLAASLRTAAEWLADEVADLDKMRAGGAIDDETYQRAKAKLEEEAARREELEKRATGAADPKQSVAGTFGGWRLGAQFGTVEQTARQQLAETKRMRHATERWLEVGERIVEKLEATHS